MIPVTPREPFPTLTQLPLKLIVDLGNVSEDGPTLNMVLTYPAPDNFFTTNVHLVFRVIPVLVDMFLDVYIELIISQAIKNFATPHARRV